MIRKRSVSLSGHRTSFSVEDEFWQELQALAQSRGVPLAALVAEIDAERKDGQNLSSAIRLSILQELKRAR